MIAFDNNSDNWAKQIFIPGGPKTRKTNRTRETWREEEENAPGTHGKREVSGRKEKKENQS